MRAQHTPGPWTMQTVPTSCGICFKVGPFPYKNGQLIHACIYADYPGPAAHKEAEANAVLIAAAPELLSAARRALAECVDLIGTPAGNALSAAIAKALGEHS